MQITKFKFKCISRNYPLKGFPLHSEIHITHPINKYNNVPLMANWYGRCHSIAAVNCYSTFVAAAAAACYCYNRQVAAAEMAALNYLPLTDVCYCYCYSCLVPEIIRNLICRLKILKSYK